MSLDPCRRFEGPEAEFWALYVETLATAAGASHVLLLRSTIGSAESWKPFVAWPPGERFPLGTPLDNADFVAALEAGASAGLAEFRPTADARTRLPVVKIEADNPELRHVALLRFTSAAPSPVELEHRIARALDLPLIYNRTRALKLANASNRSLSRTFDLMSLVDGQTRFLPAVMTLCNELARRTGCTRVSLGWRHDAYIRVCAISDMVRFERRSEVVQKLEAAMEEAFDQDEEIVLPEPDDATYVARDHDTFSRLESVAYVASVPLRASQKPVGVVTFERNDGPFSADEIEGMRVALDQATRRLDELEQADASAWRRGTRAVRSRFARLLGPEHTWWKALGVAVAVALLVIIFGTWPYRVEGNFLVRSDTLINLPAPFDGYLAEVPVRVGDHVQSGDLLIGLDKRELLLDQNSLVAEIARHEAERAQAEVERRLADMSSAAAAKEQSQASLDIIRFRLKRADITAPSDGVVIEGDLRERIGTPVRAGDLLMRMTRVEAMYVEIEVPEVDAYAVLDSRSGEIAFASLPGERYPITVERLEPVARVKSEGNRFVLRAKIDPADGEIWWRPGMSGVAKIDAGRRSILWLLTHRLVDFVRLRLWI